MRAVKEYKIMDPVEVRRARMAQYQNRSGSICLNGDTLFGSVVSVIQDASNQEICIVKFLSVPQPSQKPRARLKVSC